MIIERDLTEYVVFSEESIKDALGKIVDAKGRVIFVVTDKGRLEGLFTNGDFLRWVVEQEESDLDRPVTEIINRDFISATQDDGPEAIKKRLEEVLFVPILDRYGRLVAVARRRGDSEGIRFGGFAIGGDSPVFIIAEIGINHNGSLELAKRLIDAAIGANADCAKFQMRAMRSLYKNAGDPDDPSENLGSQYTLDILSRFQLTVEEMYEAFDYCKERGIQPLCTPWDFESLEALEEYGMPAYKVASADLTNHDLLKAIAETGKPMICSTGMSTESEIVGAVDLLRNVGAKYVLLLCNSTYPAPFRDINLRYMDRLREIGGCPVGYSGHERGINIAIAATARGAKVIEKHFTLDRSMEGNDHKVSLLPDELSEMVESIRQVELALGTASKRSLSQGERMNRVTLAKSLIANRDIAPGEIIFEDMIDVKSPGQGLQPNRKSELIGRTAKRRLSAGDCFYPSDLTEEQEEFEARDYHFRRDWGVPVRYFDFKELLEKSNPDFLEFHLSYKDLDLDVSEFFDQTYVLDLIVHSPDTFSGDHLLSPSHPKKEHRQRSIAELQRVIDLTRSLKPYFTKAHCPRIVASMGGFTRDRLLDPSERSKRYKRLAEELAELDADGVEIIPQTLPPFPWYFGGQLYLNLFVDPTDTVRFCREYGYRLCLDISHARLACNHFGWSFEQYLEKLGPFTSHLHVADAEGVSGEGLQVGEGEIDFPAMVGDLNRVAPSASFIPEIWQGHENGGRGFWLALERLEEYFGE